MEGNMKHKRIKSRKSRGKWYKNKKRTPKKSTTKKDDMLIGLEGDETASPSTTIIGGPSCPIIREKLDW